MFDQFGINFGSKMAGVSDPKWTPKAVWTSLGAVLGASWDHFKTIFDQFWTKF